MTEPEPCLAVTPELHRQFSAHVADYVAAICVGPLPSPLYFAIGLVEEAAELAEELDKEASIGQAEVVAELGDVLGYLYAICSSLKEVHPILPVSTDEAIANNPSKLSATPSGLLLAAVGRLCGSLKKWSRGDNGWDEFRPRLQGDVSALLVLLGRLGPIGPAMLANIEKIKARKERGTIKGDGNNR
jgi:hypothetical protein